MKNAQPHGYTVTFHEHVRHLPLHISNVSETKVGEVFLFFYNENDETIAQFTRTTVLSVVRDDVTAKNPWTDAKAVYNIKTDGKEYEIKLVG